MIRVVLADDQPLVRTGLRMILAAEPDIEVVGEAADGARRSRGARSSRPTSYSWTCGCPSVDGIEATRAVTAADDPPRVLVLTTFDLDEVVYDALRAGASGFLLKDAPEERLIDRDPGGRRGRLAVRAVGDPAADRGVLAAGRARPRRRTSSGLTDREHEVLRLVARGLTNAEIAAELFVTENTVKTHVARLLMKLGVRDRVQAVVLAYESGLVRPAG